MNVELQPQVLISFQGCLTQALIVKWLDELNLYCQNENLGSTLKHRLLNICLEAFQNLRIHGIGDDQTDIRVAAVKNGFEIDVSNNLSRTARLALEFKLKKTMEMDLSQISDAYFNQLSEETRNQRTAGLGIYEIVIRSEKNLSYRFKKLDEQLYRFTLQCQLNINNDHATPKSTAMNRFTSEATEELPLIILDKDVPELLISGRSIPNDSFAFYAPVKRWIEDYMLDPNEKTVLDCRLEYFNSSSQKNLVDIFKSLSKLEKMGKDVLIRWYYDEEDEQMEQIGQIFSKLLKVRFEIIATAE